MLTQECGNTQNKHTSDYFATALIWTSKKDDVDPKVYFVCHKLN